MRLPVEKLEGASGESAKSKEEPAHHIVQCNQTQSPSGIMKPGMVATSHSILPSSELKSNYKDIWSDGFTSLVAAVEALAAISGIVTGLSVGEDIKHEQTASQSPKDDQGETTASEYNQLEIVGRLGDLENDTRIPSEICTGKSASGFWQLGTTRGIPAMESLPKEPYNSQPSIAVGQIFGGTGISQDLPSHAMENLTPAELSVHTSS
ncbi:hypothetical protein O6H91_04G091600 [Diphasiastrum complanatum]|uniref:Uncharacterized protein n=1 Tax=Diphasiastrum complanatum TaxID=34168 RepID=A0ACC2DZI1_DIPCM|nr:hypothetical protein O6H91_Y278300 [Diphasiastrum complanatum]KAJ7559570.1 hypothetical protein O6H91_04G091600 [Diphasiastrum complanatum]